MGPGPPDAGSPHRGTGTAGGAAEGRRGRVAPSSTRLPRRAGTRGSAESKTACVPCQHFRAVPTDTLTPGDTRTPPKEFRGSCGGGAHHGRAPERSF